MAKLTCSICGKKVENDNFNGFKYNRKSYCYDCFVDTNKVEVVDKHMFYLRFQRLFNRKPDSVEWTQCERLVKGGKDGKFAKWDWNKLEMVLSYVYEIECLEPNDENGCIGILSYYEKKATKFFDEYNRLTDLSINLGYHEPKEVEVRLQPRTTKRKRNEIRSVDALIDWEEEV